MLSLRRISSDAFEIVTRDPWQAQDDKLCGFLSFAELFRLPLKTYRAIPQKMKAADLLAFIFCGIERQK